MGAIMLSVTAGQGTHTVTSMMDFLVVKALSSYNAILGRPTFNNLKVVTSTYHFKMKFPIEAGVSEPRGEQILARECYVQKLKARAPIVCLVSNSGEQPPPPPWVEEEQDIKARDESNLLQAKANEPLEIVKLHPERPTATTRVGTKLPPKYQEALKQLIIEHIDVFTWSYEDMPRIDNKIIEHRLCVNLEAKKVLQKRRSFGTKKCMAIAKEIDRLLAARFIREAHYPEWLFNVVLIKKPMIRMNKTDEEKTMFITSRGLYCYRVMPFGLKNSGATYQRESFVVLCEYKMKLNPAKYAFGVNSGKFLGFIVSRRGIEANTEKIEAILHMAPP
ncbi:hypothetical protein F2P56_026532 [Juglans regia]|uniref:Reverse transcriptase domain-containing protein n=2 Tax=Juglans regia TaxID=51240 RepID=A0A833U8A8_JUGRE|nr:uncharacterized protein LOC108997522 [Juglans regia]KAF5451423.1 hypothetical protein F2P56_026532 [Juglans regia]